MTDCVRCGQPVDPGQFWLRVEYDCMDIQDVLRQPEADGHGTWFARSPYRMHVDCPTDFVAEEL